MRLLPFPFYILLFILFFSCQHDLSTNDTLSGSDSTANNLLTKTVTHNSDNDSVVTNYQYNAKGNLVKQWYDNDSTTGVIHWLRDAKERIIKTEGTNSSGITLVTEVYYRNDITDYVSYTVSYYISNINKRIDSTVYIYENNRL